LGEVILIIGGRPPAEALARAAAVLAAGGLVIVPTETFYGLAADTASPTGLARLAELKGRPEGKPFPLIIAGPEQLADLAAEVPAAGQELMARHWPGPLTLVLPARPGLDPRLVSADGGVAVRVSPQPAARGLAAALGRAITATSANPAGGPPAARVEELDPEVAAAAELILDAGPAPGGLASTILDVRREPPAVLRAGPIAP
jgi:L-threonylcarbamoyladenylate synthase